MYDVSLIIPMFNAEPYLVECLDSVVAQTVFESVQVIVVDDGSTDNSLTMARSYAEAHPNVTVETQPNSGPGAARNHGLRLATGELVAFLDADDILPPRSIEARREAMLRDGADLVVADLQIFPKARNLPYAELMAEDRVLAGLAEAPGLLDNGSTCNKMFTRSFFLDPANHFLEGVHFEDAYVSVSALLEAERIGIVSELCYLYRKEEQSTSIMGGVFSRPKNFWDHLHLNEKLYARFQDDPARLALLERFLIRTIRGFIYMAHQALEEPELREYFDALRRTYARTTLADVEAYGTTTSYRIGLYELLAGDYALFAAPEKTLVGCQVDGDGINLLLDHPIVDDLAPLLHLDSATANAVGTANFRLDTATPSADGSSVSLAGTLEMTGGAKLPIPPLGLDFTATHGDVPITLLPSDAGPRHAHWTVDVPVAAFPADRAPVTIGSKVLGKTSRITVGPDAGLPLTLSGAGSGIEMSADPAKRHLVAAAATGSLAERAKRRLQRLRAR